MSTMRSTDRNSQAVATSASSKVDNLFRVCVSVVVGRYFVLNTSKDTEFTFNCYIVLMSIFNNFLCESNVLHVREVRTVDHN